MKVGIFIILYLISSCCFAQFERIKASEDTKQKMVLAKHNVDQYLINFFGEQVFKNNLQWDMFYSHVAAKYNHSYTNYLDLVSFIPQEYHLHYKVYDDSTFIDYFSIVTDSLGFVQETSLRNLVYHDYLIGYRYLLNKTFKISKLKALEIGEQYGIVGEGVYAKLINNKSDICCVGYAEGENVSFYWEVSIEDCINCKMIHICPITGRIICEYENQKTFS